MKKYILQYNNISLKSEMSKCQQDADPKQPQVHEPNNELGIFAHILALSISRND